MHRQGVLIAGSANMDMVVQTHHFPSPGETILGNGFGMYPGGKGANQAVACAKLGGLTYFIGKMGKDVFCDRLTESMRTDGVNLDYMFIDESDPTGIALITVDGKGENEIVVVSGSNMKLTPADMDTRTDIFSSVNIVLTQLEIPLETVSKAADIAQRNRITFILNPAPARELPDELLKKVTYITPNETELETLTSLPVRDVQQATSAARQLLKRGVSNVIVTLGDKGALIVNKDRSDTFPVRKTKAVDTTGAGDAFNGALAYALSKDYDINKAIKFANCVASVSVTRKGAQSSMPALNEVNEILTQ